MQGPAPGSFPLVSVVIPCWNAERYVSHAIRSALHQTYNPLEIVVVDDGSIDGSSSIISAFGNKIRSITMSRGGGSRARNAGVWASSGVYVKFLDSDDVLYPDAVKAEVGALAAGDFLPSVVPLSGSVFLCEEDRSTVVHWDKALLKLSPHEELPRVRVLQETPPVGSPLYLRSRLMEIGGFNEELSNRQDVDLFVRYASSRTRFYYSGVFGYAYRQHTSEGRVSKRPLIENHRSQLLMLRNHLKWVESGDHDEYRHEVKAVTATRSWKYGRQLMREGYRREAEEYFRLAMEVLGDRAMSGSLMYKALAKGVGPAQAEKFLELVKQGNPVFSRGDGRR